MAGDIRMGVSQEKEEDESKEREEVLFITGSWLFAHTLVTSF